VAAEALSKGAKEFSHGSQLRSVGSEGSMPPPKGIPLPTSFLASNMSEGVSRKWLEPWPHMGTFLDFPYSVYSRASFRSLEVYSGLGARYSFTWKCSPVGLPSDPLGVRHFRRGARTA
jgi:hypothetical protein